MRDLKLLDTDCERLGFQMRGSSEAVTLTASADELVGFVAGEANHEANHRRQKRLDEVVAVL